MLQFLAQLDYLRDVQRNFASSPERLDLMGVFGKILSVAIPIVVVMGLWHYRHVIGFTFLRFFARILSPRGRRIVENYLVSKGILLDIYTYTSKGVGRKLADARVKAVVGGKMQLQLINVKPTALKLKNMRVICFTKPFAFSGRKINAFVTFIGHFVKRGSVIKEMSLMTPIRYRFVIRRKHSREQAKEGAIRVKAWDGRKRKSFFVARPDIQTVNNPARYDKKTRLSVENISAGGMRMYVMNPKGKLPPLTVGSQLILRVSVWNPKTKKFSYFNVIGTIRSRFKGKGGALGMGIQFTAEGEKVGSGYVWKTLHGEMKALSQFLEKTKS
ncbi:hypothetical protein OAN24_05350 [Pseudodesulfovibrio sp.]|nr:hypothetical protein [Pseudodesulfovibrio sp.]